MKKIFLLFISFLAGYIAQAQTIKGTVTDQNNNLLIGVNIVQKNTYNGTATDGQGQFVLNLKGGLSTEIIVSYIDFATQIIDTKDQANLSVVLQPSISQISEVVVMGSRSSQNRTVVNSASPVDIIDIKEIQKINPLLNVNDVLNYLVPSFNANKQSASDGTEHIDPASLRGLGPDQVLVLVNGKKRYTTSLVNYQNTVGNGSVGTDLNALPISSIDRIEVLRDGASAQYGSDAIAGVINIILKKNIGFTANLTGGTTTHGDGQTGDLNLNYGTALGKDKGFLNLSFQTNNHQSTNRTQNHNLIIFDQSAYGNYFAYDFANNPDSARLLDDQELKARGLKRDDFNFRVGDAKVQNIQGFLNTGYKISDRVEWYAFGGLSLRNGTGYGFRRLPSDNASVVLNIFPNGFQPELNSNILDASFATGVKFKIGNSGLLDISNTYGSNSFGYKVNNTNNVSLGATSPTSFDAGSHSFSQNTVNVDYSNYFSNVLSGLNFASGAEFRLDNYQIKAGEVSSYANGGAQSFPGFSPLNALNKSRNNISLYSDVELSVTKKILVDVALRYEHYSDFGNTLNGKISGRYEIFNNFSLRASYSTGFRAPSLQQQYFNNIATDVVDGKLLNSGIFNNDNQIANVLGIPKLKQETSQNVTFGLTFVPTKTLAITLDAYQINVDNRITLSGNFGNDAFGKPDTTLRKLFATGGAATGRFFTNAINTQTRGIDLVISHKWRLGEGNLNTSLSANINKNKVLKINSLSPQLNGQEDIYYGPQERSLIETNSPNVKGTLQFIYNINRFSFLLRNTYFGKVIRNGYPFGGEQIHSPKVVTDVSVSYNILKNLSATIGTNNLFDIFPDKQIYENSYFGVFKYAPVQQGTTGRYIFTRVSFKL